MISRTVKISLGILALVVVALLVAPWFINVESYKPRIAAAIEHATGRHVDIGEIHASLFPWIGVSLKNVSLANREGFSSRPFASIGDLDIKVALLPLFSKRVEIKRFEVDGFSLSLERNTAGEENWQGLGGQPGQQAAAGTPAQASSGSTSASTALAALTAESIHLQNGSLLWSDAKSGTHVELTDLDLQVDNVNLDQPFAFKLSGKVAGGSFTADGKLGPIGKLASFDASHLPVQVHVQSAHLSLKPFQPFLAFWPATLGPLDNGAVGMDARFEQRPDGVRVTTGGMNLAAAYAVAAQWKIEMPDTQSVKVEQAQLAVDGTDLVDANGSISDLTDKPSYQFTVNSGKLTRTWLSGLVPTLHDMYAANPAPWQKISFGAIVSGDTRGLDIRDLKLMLDNDLVQASGTITFGRAPSIMMRIAANDLHADPWLPQPKPAVAQPAAAAPAGPSQGNAAKAVEPDLRFLAPWDINAQMQIERLLLKGLAFDHLRARLVAHDGKFDLNPFRFELAGGQVSEHAVLDVKSYPAQWSESARLSGVQIGPVLKALTGTNMLEGTLQMESDTKGTGLLPDNATRSLNGRGHVLLSDGMVRGFNVAVAMRSLGGALPTAAPQSTDFSQLSGSYVLTNGVAKNDDLFLASPLLRMTGKGQVNLVTKTFDYHVKPTLVGTLVGQGDTVLARKGLSVPLAISGPFSSPKIRPEINAKTIIENLQQGKGLGGLLQGTQPQQQPPANSQQQKTAPSPQQQLKKAIEGLFPH
jgi:AsmA protein